MGWVYLYHITGTSTTHLWGRHSQQRRRSTPDQSAYHQTRPALDSDTPKQLRKQQLVVLGKFLCTALWPLQYSALVLFICSRLTVILPLQLLLFPWPDHIKSRPPLAIFVRVKVVLSVVVALSLPCEPPSSYNFTFQWLLAVLRKQNAPPQRAKERITDTRNTGWKTSTSRRETNRNRKWENLPFLLNSAGVQPD